jgi:1-acyl-sn-glycerol-3-phosphate acyltransferase
MTSILDDLRQMAKGWRWTHRPLTPRSAEPWVGDPEPHEFPTGWARTPAAKATREAVLRYVFRPIVWSESQPSVQGLDNLEHLAPPVLFVANHASHMDTPLLLCSLPRSWRERTAVAAAADYFFDVWWRAATTALVFNTFPIERTGGKRATTTARKLIGDGWNLVVYPEGTRSRDGWLGRWRHGAARLAVEYGLPVVPVALRGTFATMPRGRSWPVKGRLPVSVRFGAPIHPEPGEEFPTLSRRMQQELARLSDEDASTWWESLRREAEDRTPAMTGPEAPRWRRVWEASRPLPRRTGRLSHPGRVWPKIR